MSSLCVVVTGLVALAPPVDTDKSAKVLLRRIDKAENVNGDKIFPHLARVRFSTGPGPAGVQTHELTKGETVGFTLPDGGGPQIAQPERFIPVGPNLDQPLKTKAAFRNGAGDSTVMSGRVVLTGGVISPIELADIFDLQQVKRQITAELRGAKVLGGPQQNLPAPRLVANGFLYERDLADGETPAIQIDGGASVPLVPTPAANLGFLAGAAGDVYVVWVVNTAVHPDGTPSAKSGAAQRAAGKRAPAAAGPPAAPGFDPDFERLFDFVDGIDVKNRLIPLVSDPQEGPGDPPGHCMPGLCG